MALMQHLKFAHSSINVSLFNRCPVCRREIDSGVSAKDFTRNYTVENMIKKMDNLSVAPIVSF